MSKNMDSLGDRMKANYEDRSRYYLTRRTPVIIRLDGRAFHTLLCHCQKPFDDSFRNTMSVTALNVCCEIQGAKCAYVQSDEISILLTDFDTLETQAWFDYNLQKLVSVSASLTSTIFTFLFPLEEKIATFDSRAFNIPKEEVANYFVWRQKDWIRNSVTMLAQSHFSHKELMNKSQADMHDMLHEIGVNWVDLDAKWKNGTLVYKKQKDDGQDTWTITNTVIFQENRNLIEQYLCIDKLSNI